VEGSYTSFAAQVPGTVSNFFFLLFLIGIVALIVLGVLRRSQTTSAHDVRERARCIRVIPTRRPVPACPLGCADHPLQGEEPHAASSKAS
jgi:hypothetical protein